MRTGAVLGVLALMCLTLMVRSLGFEFVFVEGEVVFPPADAQYHLRRALYTYENFPAVLLFDPYINFPGGASIPWPPLYDFLVGAVAFVFASSVRGFEQIAAFSAPICAALAILPIYLAGVRLGSRHVGFAAGFFYALLPLAASYTRVGNADHHAAVAMIGAWLLYAGMGLADTQASTRRLTGFAVLFCIARTALLLTWHGSLLYIGLADGLVLLAAVISGRRVLLLLQGVSILATLMAVVPLVVLSPEPLGGSFSSIALSWLDVWALLAVAWVALIVLCLDLFRPEAGPGLRLAMAWLGGIVFIVFVGMMPEAREGLSLAFGFLTMADGVGQMTAEQSPLFNMSGRGALQPAWLSWGFFAYLIPFAPAAAIWAALQKSASPAVRWGAGYLFLWSLLFAFLTLGQRRYGNDFSPAASVLFGFAAVASVEKLVSLTRVVKWRTTLVSAGAGVLLVVGFWPSIWTIYGPRTLGSWAALSGDPRPRVDVETSVAHTLHTFLRQVRVETPETSGYLEPGHGPEYGVISPANLGHAIQYTSRRATATDPFWWYIGLENWNRSFAFLESEEEAEALALAAALRARYVITSQENKPLTVAGRLHAEEGRGKDEQPGLSRFRLISESIPGGLGLGALFYSQSAPRPAYKLFEIVPGAQLEVTGKPGETVVAQVRLETNQGRKFIYRNTARVEGDGTAQLVLPYATETSQKGSPGFRSDAQTQARGPYRVSVGGVNRALRVKESDVLEGRAVRL